MYCYRAILLTTLWGTVGHLLEVPFSLLFTTRVHPAVYRVDEMFIKEPWALVE